MYHDPSEKELLRAREILPVPGSWTQGAMVYANDATDARLPLVLSILDCAIRRVAARDQLTSGGEPDRVPGRKQGKRPSP